MGPDFFKTLDYKFIKESDKFLAHPNESLELHSKRTLYTANEIIKQFGIEDILQRAYSDIFTEEEQNNFE